jgi:hypothetical protein
MVRHNTAKEHGAVMEPLPMRLLDLEINSADIAMKDWKGVSAPSANAEGVYTVLLSVAELEGDEAIDHCGNFHDVSVGCANSVALERRSCFGEKM